MGELPDATDAWGACPVGPIEAFPRWVGLDGCVWVMGATLVLRSSALIGCTTQSGCRAVGTLGKATRRRIVVQCSLVLVARL